MYAKRTDATIIFEVGADLFDQLQQELRQEPVWTFQADDVTAFSVKSSTQDFVFERRDAANGRCRYGQARENGSELHVSSRRESS